MSYNIVAGETKDAHVELDKTSQNLGLVKDELKSKTKHWYPQWREVAIKWIDETKIILKPAVKPEFKVVEQADSTDFGNSADSGAVKISIEFPNSVAPKFEIILEPQLARTIIFTEWSEHVRTTTRAVNKLPVDQFQKYRRTAELEAIPINLHGDLIFDLINLLDNDDKSQCLYENSKMPAHSRYNNWLFVEDCHIFPGCSISSLAKGENGWVNGIFYEIVIGGKLLSARYYRDNLIVELMKNQLMRLTHNYFWRRKEKVLGHAQKFVSSLYFYKSSKITESNSYAVKTWLLTDLGISGDVDLVKFTSSQNATLDEIVDIKLVPTSTSTTSTTSTIISNGTVLLASTAQTATVVERVTYVSCWTEVVKLHPEILNLVGDLTTSDIEWILSAFIQTKRIGETMKIVLNDPNDLNRHFPTVNDRFDSFDPQHLRGILTQTATSKRLANHVENIECLRREAMDSTSSVPTALVDLAESYLPV